MSIPGLSNPYTFILTTLCFFLIILIRYFLFTGFFYLFFHSWYKKTWSGKKINPRNYSSGQFKKEIKWSIISSIIFAFTGTLVLWMWQKGFTKIYTQVNNYSWLYIPVSFITLVLIHETYYYWLHRWMHMPGIFKTVHKVHHDSYITSPFTAFSFHPIECFIQAVFFPLIVVVLPLHYFIIIALLIIMTLSSIINHLGIEIYPKNFNRNVIGKWLIGATHHSLHHMQYKFNYGLYFTFWDKIKKTESDKFDSLFDKIAGSQKIK